MKNITRGKGRPKKSEKALSHADILTAAFELLDAKGSNALTMRALARNLNINPMSIYHHIGSRDQLLKVMIEEVYHDLPEVPLNGSPGENLKLLLSMYCERVISHPNLTLSIFSSTEFYTGHTQVLTVRIGKLLKSLGLTKVKAARWLDILIDYTHGFALATAKQAQSEEGVNTRSFVPDMSCYCASIDLLIRVICETTNKGKS